MKTFLNLGLSALLLVTLSGCTAKNEPPSARMVEPANNSHTNERTVVFKAQSNDPENKIKSAVWSFGDGKQESAGDEVSHRYANGGEYTVHYTVTDDKGQSATAAVRVSINQAPLAAARAQRQSGDGVLPAVKFVDGQAPLEVQFEGSASKDPDGQVDNVAWDFGDGATSTELDPVHTYQTIGQYDAVLTVTDDEGSSAQDRVKVRVAAPPLSVTDFVDTQATLPAYSLIKGFTLSGQENNKTMLYQYRMDDPGPFEHDSVRLTLLDAAMNLALHPEISRMTIYLFTEAKAGFMDPGEYDHYLGMLEWQRPQSDVSPTDLAHHVANNATLSFNDSYFDGSAPTVVGYEVYDSELDPDDPRCTICDNAKVVYVSLVLNPTPKDVAAEDLPVRPPLCLEQVQTTLRMVLQRALKAPAAYALNVYEGSVVGGNGLAVGLWGSDVDISGLSPDSGLLFSKPQGWDIDEERFKLKFTAELPACPLP